MNIVLRKAKTACMCTLWRIVQEWRVRVNELRLCFYRSLLLLGRQKTDFRIWGWYGRIGNNIQQLIVAIAHAEVFHGCTAMDGDLLIEGPLEGLFRPFREDFAVDRPVSRVLCTTFFHYTEYTFGWSYPWRIAYRRGYSPRRDSLLGRRYIEHHAHRIVHQYLRRHFCFSLGVSSLADVYENTVVIHLRAGDVATMSSPYYMTNPLCFYRELARQYSRAVIVTEPATTHPLFYHILALFSEYELVSGSPQADFSVLCRAIHLASSGVGTFVLAAALLSERLKVFHCTDLYQTEHLNPRMLCSGRVTVRQKRLPGFRRKWLAAKDRVDLLLKYASA